MSWNELRYILLTALDVGDKGETGVLNVGREAIMRGWRGCNSNFLSRDVVAYLDLDTENKITISVVS